MKRWQHDLDAPLADDELNAFADGQLQQPDAARVAVQIRRCPEHAERIYQYWRHEAELYRNLRPLLQAPPADWPSRQLATRSSRWRQPWPLAATAAVLLLAVFGYRSLTAPAPARADFVDLAMSAYLNAPGNGEHPGAAAPVFANLGLEPVGQQVLQMAGQRFVEFRYSDGGEQQLALYQTDSHRHYRDGWLHVLPQGQVPLVEWRAEGKRYLLVGGGSSLELARLAVDMKAQLQQAGVPAAATPQALPAEPPTSGNGPLGGAENGHAQGALSPPVAYPGIDDPMPAVSEM